MKFEKTSVRLVALFCLYLYPVMIKDSPTLSYAYQYGVPLAYIILNYRVMKRISLKQAAIIGAQGLLVVFSFLYPALHFTDDFSYVGVSTFAFRKAIVYIFLAILIVKEYGKDASIEHFMYYYALVHSIYVVGTLLLVLVPDLRTFWFTLFDETISSGDLYAYGYTFRIGWTGFAGFRLTMHCTWSCVFLLYLFYAAEERYRIGQISFIPAFALCCLGTMFYGRSGLVLSIGCSAVGILIWNRKQFLRILKFAVIFALLVVVVYLLRNVSIFSDWYIWMSTPILNFVKTGNYGNASFDTLTKEMIWMPEIKSILLGDGRFTGADGLYYLHTDSGIMRNILFWGVVGVTVSYGVTVVCLDIFRERSVLLWLLFLITFAAFELKGDVYYEYTALAFSMSFIDNAVFALYPPDKHAGNQLIMRE